MVQNEVRKKTRIYALAAVLLAIVLVGMIYVYGGSPSINLQPGKGTTGPINQFPISNGQGSLTASELAASGMKTFASLDELKNYVNNTSGQNSYSGGPLDSAFFTAQSTPTPAPTGGLCLLHSRARRTICTCSSAIQWHLLLNN